MGMNYLGHWIAIGIEQLAPVLIDYLQNKVLLTGQEPGLEFVHTVFSDGECLSEVEILLPEVVHDTVDEIGCIAMGTVMDLLTGAQIVYPVQTGSLVVDSPEKTVDLVWAFSESLGELRSDVVGSLRHAHLPVVPKTIQAHILLDVFAEVDSVGTVSSEGQ